MFLGHVSARFFSGNGHRFTSNGDMDNRVVRPPEILNIAQKTKNATVYTDSGIQSSDWPSQLRLCGSTIAKTSISVTPAIKNAGHKIHIRRCCNIVVPKGS